MTEPTTKKARRRANLLSGALTPKWMKYHNGPRMRQFRQQFNRAAKR